MNGERTYYTYAVWGVGALVLGLYVLTCGLYWTQINDDAFITFRYSKFLAMGRGPYFNVGEHVEGYTNFLLMLLMAGAIRLFGDDEVLFVAKLIGVGGGIAACCAAWALGRRWLSKIESAAPYADLLAWGGGGLAAVTCTYAFNSTTGLETTLFSALILLGLWLDQKQRDERRYRAAGVAFALAALTRPEGIMIFALATLGRLFGQPWKNRTARFAVGMDCLIVGVVVGLHFVLRFLLYDGELVPNTYYAKSGGMARLTPWLYVRGFLSELMAWGTPLLALLSLIARNRVCRLDAAPTLFVVWGALASIWLTGSDWMPGQRLLMPFIPAWGALITCGIAAAADRAQLRPALVTGIASFALLVGLFWWQNPAREYHYEYCTLRAEGYLAGHAALGDWLREHAAPGATIALMDIGLVSYKCIDQHILDITGLTDRYIAKSPGGFLTKEFDPAYVFNRHPQYIVIAVQGPPGEIDRGKAVEKLGPWTQIEMRLMQAPIFRRHYFNSSVDLGNVPELEWLAGKFGARLAFRHAHPGLSYLLFLYEYHD